MKSRKKLLANPYINISGIQHLLGIDQRPASKIFKQVSAQEDKEMGEYRIVKNRVQTKNVLKHQNMTMAYMLKLIELDEEEQKENAPPVQQEERRLVP